MALCIQALSYLAADELVYATRWSEEEIIEVPARGAAFHPYGAAVVWQAAGFFFRACAVRHRWFAERVNHLVSGQVERLL